MERVDRPGFWQSVTGSVEESDKTLRETAQRELFEETGFQGDDGVLTDCWWANQFKIDSYWQSRYAKHVHWNTEHVFGFCLPDLKIPCLSSQEHTRFEWMEWRQALDRVFSPSNRQAIQWVYRFGV